MDTILAVLIIFAVWFFMIGRAFIPLAMESERPFYAWLGWVAFFHLGCAAVVGVMVGFVKSFHWAFSVLLG